MTQHRYEAIAWNREGKSEVIKPANSKGDAIQAAARLIAEHADKPGTLIFIRQYYASQEPGRFRVLHKYTRRITAPPEHAGGFIVIAVAGRAPLETPVSSCAEASAVWQSYRDEHGLAASDMGARCGHVYTAAGELVAKVSYNGRVWDTHGKQIEEAAAL